MELNNAQLLEDIVNIQKAVKFIGNTVAYSEARGNKCNFERDDNGEAFVNQVKGFNRMVENILTKGKEQ